MATWIRFQYNSQTHFGQLNQEDISVYEGDLFGKNKATGETLSLSDVSLLTPCTPSKFLALWNNFHATAEKTGLPQPGHPWYFVKTPNSYAAANSIIRKPKICEGKILFEGELGTSIRWPTIYLGTPVSMMLPLSNIFSTKRNLPIGHDPRGLTALAYSAPELPQDLILTL